MVKRFVSAWLALSLLPVCALALGGEAEPDVSAKSAIVISSDTGEVLFEKNADERMLVASTTKVMTALVALQHCAPTEAVEVKLESTVIEGSSMYLKPGESYTVEDLLYGLLLVSGNDAAHALAMHIGGGVEGFAALMNKKAEELGLQNSSFRNPHGLDAEGHYSTARDLALIMREAMKNELFRRITKTRSITINDITYVNHNRLLSLCEGVNGGKTGYTRAAGRSLISSCERGGTSFIAVTLDDPDDWVDHCALYSWAYGKYEYRTVVRPGEYRRLPVISGEREDVGVAPVESLSVLLLHGTEVSVEAELPRFAFAGVRAGERAGVLIVRCGDEEIGRASLCYTEDVPIGRDIRLTLWERFSRGWYMYNRYGIHRYGFYAV